MGQALPVRPSCCERPRVRPAGPCRRRRERRSAGCRSSSRRARQPARPPSIEREPGPEPGQGHEAAPLDERRRPCHRAPARGGRRLLRRWRVDRSASSLSQSRGCSVMLLPAQAVALDLLVQVGARHLERARRLGHVPVVLAQLAEQEALLRFLLERPRRSGCRRRGRCRRRRSRAGSRRSMSAAVTILARRQNQQRARPRCAARARCPARPAPAAAAPRPRRTSCRAPRRSRRAARAKWADQRRDVLAPLAQRRHVDRHHVQPVEQVLAEPALGDLLLEILVGGREHPHVHLNRLGARRSG